jgi:hypothetical protein
MLIDPARRPQAGPGRAYSLGRKNLPPSDVRDAGSFDRSSVDRPAGSAQTASFNDRKKLF